MSVPRLLVTIDGPAGAGKSTVARRVAEHFGLPLLDTGAIYRTLAWAARRKGIEWDDESALAELARDFPIAFTVGKPGDPPKVTFAGEDVSREIRTPEISQGASRVSAHPQVRAALLGIQRRLGRQGCVAEGRDMGTVVFPDAPFKFFLTADLAVRAMRRHDEEVSARGADRAPSLDDVVAEMTERDHRDSSRSAAPLTQADDAVRVDSSTLDIDAVLATIIAQIESR